jgi:DNA-binding SARP family transcriptional activator
LAEIAAGKRRMGYPFAAVPDPSEVVIEILGAPFVTRGGRRVTPGPLLVRLAAAHPHPVRRDDLIASLYPDAPVAEARNRLRVALTRLRRSVPLREAGDHVGLDPDLVRVDVADLRERLRETGLEPAAAAEARALEELLPRLGQLLFPDPAGDWELQAQSAWSETACAALERLGELAEQLIDHALAAAAAEAALRHFPYDAAAWERYLRAMTRLGRGSEAARSLAAARRRARAEGWPFPEALDAWVPQSEESDALGPELSPGESSAMERFFRRALVAQPELAVEMLGSSSFRPEVLRAPRAVLPLLREALALPTPPSEALERIQVRVISALGLIENHAAVLEAVAELLSRPVAPARRRIALLAASFAHAMQGDLDAAIAAVEEAMSLAAGPTAEYDRYECRAQRATFVMLGGDLAAAEAELRAALAYLEAHSIEGAEADRLTIGANVGLCLTHQGRFPEAVEALRPVVDAARFLRLQRIVGFSAPVLGFALSQVGGEAGPLLTDGLRAAFRMGPRRAVTAAAYAGRALLTLGMDPELSVLTEALGFRLASGPPLNSLEKDLYSPVLGQRPEPLRPLVEFVRSTMRACSRAAGG